MIILKQIFPYKPTYCPHWLKINEKPILYNIKMFKRVKYKDWEAVILVVLYKLTGEKI